MICAVLRNFRSLTDTTLRIGGDARVALVLGNNGAGKSSIAGAIEYALTGCNEWTDRRGAGAATLVAHGAPSATIDLLLGDLTVQRTIKPKGCTVAVGEYTGEKAEAKLAMDLPDPDLLRCMLRSDGFVTLKSKAQQDILFRLSGGEVNGDWVAAKLTAGECDVLSEALSTRLKGSALMEHLHGLVYGQRTEANARVKELAARTAEPAQDAPPADDENRLALELAKARKALADRQQQAGAAQEQIRAHDAAVTRCERARDEFKAAQEQLAAHGTRPGEVSDADFEALRAAMKNAEKALADAESAHFAAASPLIAARTRVEQLETLGGSCVLASDIPCPMTQDQIAKLREAASAAVSEAAEAEQAASAAMRAARTACTTATDAFAGAQSLRTAGETWDARAEVLNERLEQVRATLHAAEAEYQANPAPDPTAIQSNLEAAQRRADQAEDALRAVQEAMNAAGLRKRDLEELARAEERAALLDELVGKLSPTGLPAEAMRDTVGKVIDQINDVLAEFCDLEVSFADELLVRDGDRQSAAIPVRYLSESEKLRVGSAISVAFAKITELNFVVVDASDRLDPAGRVPHLQMLLDSGVQAVVLAVPQNGTRPSAPGLITYELENGRLVDVARAQEVAA